MSKRIVAIMAGGAGERFWPVSRRDYPKQLLALTGEQSMLALSVERAAKIVGIDNVYILTNAALRNAIIEALPALPEKNIIGEPVSRNTAACLGLALAHTGYEEDAPTMGVLTADHHITDLERFAADVDAAFAAAEENSNLVTMGIPPTRPETGYGYIELDQLLTEHNGSLTYRLLRFHEKPDAETARRYMAAQNFLWNSGMFFWKNAVLFDAFQNFMPELADGIARMRDSLLKGDAESEIKNVFESLESVSIDYGVMERAKNILCVKATFGWDDVGTWDALDRIAEADEEGNVVIGKNATLEVHNSIIYRKDDDAPIITALGVNHLVIVSTKDAVMICQKKDAQAVKQLVQKLKDENLERYL